MGGLAADRGTLIDGEKPHEAYALGGFSLWLRSWMVRGQPPLRPSCRALVLTKFWTMIGLCLRPVPVVPVTT